MLPSDSKDVSINFAYQCLHIPNNKEILNGLKGSTKMKKYIQNSNNNNVYTIFKGTLFLVIEVKNDMEQQTISTVKCY